MSSVIVKTTANAECCDRMAYDPHNELCCGPHQNKTILKRSSKHHECCGHGQFDTLTQCCCEVDGALRAQPITSVCCPEEEGVQPQNPAPQLNCTVLHTSLPSSSRLDRIQVAYDPDNELCCGPHQNKTILKRSSKHHECCGHGQFDTLAQCCCEVDGALKAQPITSVCCPEEEGQRNVSNKSNPLALVCCGGCRSGWRPSIDQHSRRTLHRLAKNGALCCDEILHTDGAEVEKSLDLSDTHHQAAGTICRSQFHASPGQHCCGKDVYEPQKEICCNEYRYPKVKNLHCCGVQAYNIKDRLKKCCAGTLYNLMSGQSADDVQCCGSILKKTSDVCCRSEDKELLYSAKLGFRCCGESYYNASLWSCCAGRLYNKPEQHQRKLSKESGLLSLNNLAEVDLCGEMYIGIVDSVSPHSVVFSSVVKIHGWNSTVEHLTSTHYLRMHDYCGFPKLTPGETYFFNNKHHIFTDFNHDSIYQSLQFIISKCYRPQASSGQPAPTDTVGV
ncbi:uncharacterized protein si:ch211-195m9.3 isoform X3 [Xyrichtys novacula]|nr:uncharacterized protein si:ch211-195m9.3 isoform X3 [Xyrichtys novacula]